MQRHKVKSVLPFLVAILFVIGLVFFFTNKKLNADDYLFNTTKYTQLFLKLFPQKKEIILYNLNYYNQKITQGLEVIESDQSDQKKSEALNENLTKLSRGIEKQKLPSYIKDYFYSQIDEVRSMVKNKEWPRLKERLKGQSSQLKNLALGLSAERPKAKAPKGNKNESFSKNSSRPRSDRDRQLASPQTSTHAPGPAR